MNPSKEVESSAFLPELNKKSVLPKASLRSFWSKLFFCSIRPGGAGCASFFGASCLFPRPLACVVLGPFGVGGRRRVAGASAGRRLLRPAPRRSPACVPRGPLRGPLRLCASLRAAEHRRSASGQYTAVLRRILAAILRSSSTSAMA